MINSNKKIDVEKFICSMIEAFPAFKEEGRIPCMYKEALAAQGLEYRDGRLVEAADEPLTEFERGMLSFLQDCKNEFNSEKEIDFFIHRHSPRLYELARKQVIKEMIDKKLIIP